MSDDTTTHTADELLARLAEAEATIARLQADDVAARADADVKVIEASADADVKRIEAAAEAETKVIEAAVEATAPDPEPDPEPVADELLDDEPDGDEGEPVKRAVAPEAEHWLFKPLW